MSELVTQSIRFAANSCKGLRYEKNEDAYLVLPEWNVFAVADGMGGHNGGAVASNMVVDHIVKSLQEFEQMPNEDNLMALIQQANHEVYQAAQLDQKLRGMGSTLSLLFFDRSQVVCFHVGDSRIYRHLNFVATQLTKDHTKEVEDLGQRANTHKSNRGITRALGVRPKVKIDSARFMHEEGAEYLLVSDGVSDVLPNFEITNIVSDVNLSYRKRIDRLLDAVETKAGSDDKTAVIVAPQ